MGYIYNRRHFSFNSFFIVGVKFGWDDFNLACNVVFLISALWFSLEVLKK